MSGKRQAPAEYVTGKLGNIALSLTQTLPNLAVSKILRSQNLPAFSTIKLMT